MFKFTLSKFPEWNMEGGSGGICTTLVNDSMNDSKQKVFMNLGPILNGYGIITAWNLEI